jgi:hypothetical protein
MADRIPTYIDQQTQRITELAVDDSLDVGAVKATDVEVTNLTIGGDAYAPYDDTELRGLINDIDIPDPYDDSGVKADISTNASAIAANTTAIGKKLDADKIWTGTEAQYNSTSKDPSVLYFITG